MTEPRPAESRGGVSAGATPAAASTPLRSSALGRVGLWMLGQWGARIGMGWVLALLLMAVFAPVVASSHPYVWKVDGRVGSPWVEHLTAADVVLLGSFLVAVVLVLWRRASGAWRLQAWLWITAAITATAAARALPVLWAQRELGQLPLVFLMTAAMLLSLLFVLVVVPWWSSASVRAWSGTAAVGLVLCGAFWAADVRPPANIVYSAYREATAAEKVEWQLLPPLAYSPSDYQRDRMSAEGVDPRVLPPSLRHPFGTDESGADVLSRMIHASRIALAIGLIATGIAVLIGIVVGGLMGYFAGWVDLLGMRIVEVFSAIPVIFLLIMIVAFYGRNLYLMMVIIGITGWVGYATFIRAEFLKLRKMDFVQAAHACGTPLRSVLFRHMLPNGVTPVLVLASFGIAQAILIESTLSFLGLGLVEEPSWGQLLNQSRSAAGQWGLTIFPGLAIFLTVFAYNLVGEALRDALDPRVASSDDS
ncbi:MAG: ABC transporter permease [Planctomycetota bacterium]